MSVEVRADSRLSSSSAEAELSVELNLCLKLLQKRLAILSELVTLSTTICIYAVRDHVVTAAYRCQMVSIKLIKYPLSHSSSRLLLTLNYRKETAYSVCHNTALLRSNWNV